MRILLLIALLLINTKVIADNKPRKLGPRVEVYYQPGIFAAPFSTVKATTDRARRLMSNLTNVSIRVDFKTSPLSWQCKGIGNEFYYNDESEIEFYCIWQNAEKKGLLANNRIAYFITQPLVPRTGERFLIGGFAWRGCYNNLHPNNSVAGLGVGNYLEFQIDKTSRVTQSMAIIMHEWGHLLFNLIHDENHEEYLMNTLFNVNGISTRIPPHLWKLSEKSKKQVRKCVNFRSRQ